MIPPTAVIIAHHWSVDWLRNSYVTSYRALNQPNAMGAHVLIGYGADSRAFLNVQLSEIPTTAPTSVEHKNNSKRKYSADDWKPSSTAFPALTHSSKGFKITRLRYFNV